MSAAAPYGSDHQRRRALAIKEAYGTPCPRCGEVMLKGQALDYGHSTDRAFDSSAKADRIEHADYSACSVGGNRSAGGVLGRAIQDLRPSRQW